MQTSKTHTWANDDGMVNPVEEPASTSNQPTEDKGITEELPSHPKKARVQEPPSLTKDAEAPKPVVVDQSEVNENVDIPMSDKQEKDEEEGETAPVSDADWLRSKTSRLLGLLDEDEQAEFNDHKAEEPAKARSPSAEEPESRNGAIDNIAAQPPTNQEEDDDEEEQEDAPQTTEEQNKNIELIRDSARLFVRNLAYDTTDADLQPLFAEYGKLEEVSLFFSIFFFPFTLPFIRTNILRMHW